jgi:glycosyltransferase involved in cell wall biosynthesis
VKRITASICTYERYDLLEKALGSVLEQSLGPDQYDILVVDNSPPNDRAGAFKQRFEQHQNLSYLLEPTPGLSNARNVAARTCNTDLIAYLDDDAVASQSWLREVCNAFDAFGDKAGVVGGRIDPIWGAPRPAWLPDDMLGMLTVVNWGGQTRPIGPNEWVAGANISFRVGPLLEIGGFQTSLGRLGSSNVLLSSEESQVVEALTGRGYDVIWAPKAKVDHLVDRRRLERKWIRSRMAWQAVSDFIKNSEQVEARQASYWNALKRYFNSLPPRLRNPNGLFEEMDDPAKFKEQVGAFYNTVMLLLLGDNEKPGPRDDKP